VGRRREFDRRRRKLFRTAADRGAEMAVFVGVSGFSYPSWKGKFYPKDAKSEEFLGYYSQYLDTVEINSSFYAVPSASMVKSWSEKTSEKFRFSFKAPGRVTHMLKLGEGASQFAQSFSRTIENLGTRLGPVLFQLPPFMKQDRELLDGFLSSTASIKDRVFEFRNKSWMEGATFRLLEKHGVAFCIAETDDSAPTFQVTGKFAYFRLRKESYDGKAIAVWAQKIKETVKGVEQSYAYLRHDETGENAALAQRLSGKLQG